VLLTLADLISFYVRQFDSVFVVLGHLVLLIAVIASRDPLRAEDASTRTVAGPSQAE
jgi:hypothetical protein